MHGYPTTFGFVGFAMIGLAAALVPSLMPSISAEYLASGLTLGTIGALVPAAAVGALAGTVLAGFGSDTWGRVRLVWISALLLAATLALTAGTPRWAMFLLCFSLASTAQGALSTGINALIAGAASPARARALNSLHGVYGIGAAASPLIIGSLLAVGVAWRAILAGAGALWLVYALVVFAALRSGRPEPVPPRGRRGDWRPVRGGAFVALWLIAFIYNGVAVSLLSWLALFAQRSAGYSVFVSISMVSLFYLALTAGRFMCAAAAERLGYSATLLLLACCAALAYPPIIWGSGWLLAAGVLGTGLGLSGLFPTALADGARRYPERAGAVSAALGVALTLGSVVPPLWTGLVAQLAGLQVALGVNYAMLVLLVLLARWLGRSDSRAAAGLLRETAP